MQAFLLLHHSHTFTVVATKSCGGVATIEIYESLGTRLEENSVPGFVFLLEGDDQHTLQSKLQAALHYLLVSRFQAAGVAMDSVFAFHEYGVVEIYPVKLSAGQQWLFCTCVGLLFLSNAC